MRFDPVLVHAWLSRTAQRFPDKTALVCDGRRLSYAEIDQASTRLARSIVNKGLEKGDRVVVFMENSAEAVIGIYGILKAGGVFVVAEAVSTASSLKHVLRDSGARLVMTHIDKAEVVEGALSDRSVDIRVVWAGKPDPASAFSPAGLEWEVLLGEPNLEVALPRVIDIDLAALIYTSGSTGRPKGIMCTHHNMVSAARSIIQYIGNDENDVILDVLPLAFDYGLYQVLMGFMFGGTIVLEREMGFLEPMIRAIEKEGVTGFPVVPVISAVLLKMKRLPVERFSSLRYVTSTGALWPAAHIRQFRELLPNVTFFSMYGLTECKRVGFLPPELIDSYSESVGRAMPNCDALVIDEKGNPVRPGETGELIVRGSNVMQGYWNDRETTEQFFRAGRYPDDRVLHTGDWFRLGEEGLLYFVGRRDDLIKSFGRRVGPREVEDIIVSMPGIAEAAVVGVADEINGQVPGAFVVTKEGSGLDESGIKIFCAKHLEPYKIPQYLWFVDSLPRTPNGKVDKRSLKDQASASLRKSGSS
jgi:amino acid adenylation domain-containing protein